MKVAICTLSQSMTAPSGLLSWFSQLAHYLPKVDPATEYHFIVSEATRSYITGNSRAFTDLVGWDNAHRFMRVISEHLLVGAWAKRNAIDALLMANAGTAPLYLPRPVKLVQGIFGFHHNSPTDLLPATRLYRRVFFDRTIHRADRIVINSEYSRDVLTRLAPQALAKTRVVPHGRNNSLFHAGRITANEEAEFAALQIATPFIAFVSQIYPYKNVRTAVDGFCRFVRQTGAPHQLAVIGKFSTDFGQGEEYGAELVGIARDYGLQNRLQFRSSVSVTALRTIYCKADAYIQSSLSETFGRTSLEAMACGCPVVAAQAAATPEIVGDAGVYFDGLNAQDCADALARLISDSSLSARCKERGIIRAGLYSIENEARQLAAVFSEIV